MATKLDTKGVSWSVKLTKPRSVKRVLLDAPFAGIPAGAMLFVGTPDVVANYIRKIPAGETRMIERLRREIARNNDCDAMCPVSTAIFPRMVKKGHGTICKRENHLTRLYRFGGSSRQAQPLRESCGPTVHGLNINGNSKCQKWEGRNAMRDPNTLVR